MSGGHDMTEQGAGPAEPPALERYRTMAFRLTAIMLSLSPCVSAPCWAEQATEEAQSVSLTTTDGLVLQCLFYPGAANKETIPIILLRRA